MLGTQIWCAIMVPLSLYSESLIVIWGLKCKDAWITAKAAGVILQSLINPAVLRWCCFNPVNFILISSQPTSNVCCLHFIQVYDQAGTFGLLATFARENHCKLQFLLHHTQIFKGQITLL